MSRHDDPFETGGRKYEPGGQFSFGDYLRATPEPPPVAVEAPAIPASPEPPEVIGRLQGIIPGLSETVGCPACTYSTLGSVIVHLNDYHAWKATDIADWADALDIDTRVHLETP